MEICDHISVFGNSELPSQRLFILDREKQLGIDRVRDVNRWKPESLELLQRLGGTSHPEVHPTLPQRELWLLEIEKRWVVGMRDDKGPLQDPWLDHREVLPKWRMDDLCGGGRGFANTPFQRSANLT